MASPIWLLILLSGESAERMELSRMLDTVEELIEQVKTYANFVETSGYNTRMMTLVEHLLTWAQHPWSKIWPQSRSYRMLLILFWVSLKVSHLIWVTLIMEVALKSTHFLPKNLPQSDHTISSWYCSDFPRRCSIWFQWLGHKPRLTKHWYRWLTCAHVTVLTFLSCCKLNRCYINSIHILEITCVLFEILSILLFKGVFIITVHGTLI